MTGLEGDDVGTLSDPAILRVARAALLDANATSVLAAARHAVCDPTRAQIVRVLGTGPLAVSDLTRIIGRQRTVTSQHLRVLRDAGLVEAHRHGRSLYYRLTSAQAVHVAQTALEAAARANR
jgi:ArsR family transcriptional regulator